MITTSSAVCSLQSAGGRRGSSKATMATSNNTTATSADESNPRLFLHVQYKVPDSADGGCSFAEQMEDTQTQTQTQAIITKQSLFDASNCPAAIVGLHPSVEPVKPDPGDYSYSGMHDHGPLPPPKEGGQFAQIIGFVNAAKKALAAIQKRLSQAFNMIKRLGAKAWQGLLNFFGLTISKVTIRGGGKYPLV